MDMDNYNPHYCQNIVMVLAFFDSQNVSQIDNLLKFILREFYLTECTLPGAKIRFVKKFDHKMLKETSSVIYTRILRLN